MYTLFGSTMGKVQNTPKVGCMIARAKLSGVSYTALLQCNYMYMP